METPWWQKMIRSPRTGVAMGGSYLVLGVGSLLLAAFGGFDAWWWAIGSVWLVFAVFYLSLAVAMKRHASSGRGATNEHRSLSSSQ